MDDQKDFAEHLRTVQFTLLATCLGLVVVTTSPGQREIVIAHRQILAALEIAKWKSDWLESLAEERVNARLKSQVVETPEFPPVPALKAIEFEHQRYNVKFTGPSWWIYVPKKQESIFRSTNDRVEVQTATVGTLHGFRALWDALSHLSVDTTPVFSTNKCVFTLDGGKKRFIARWSEIPSSNHYKEMPFGLTEILAFADLVGVVGDDPNYVTREATAVRPKASATTDGDSYPPRPRPGEVDYIGAIRKQGQEDPDTLVWLPIYFRDDFDLDAQGYAVVRFPDLLRHGTFADVFHELDSTTERYQNVDLATTEKIIRSEVARSKETFEAFGMKFPVETTARWGILMLLAVQLYFWLHLTEYRRRNIVDPSIAWIGSYSSVFARSVFCIATLAAPTFVVCLVALKGNLSPTPSLPNWLGAFVVTFLSLILSAITARTYFTRPAILEAPDDD